MNFVTAALALSAIGPGSITAQLTSQEQAFVSDVEAYAAKSPSMPPRIAAARWLELVDKGAHVPNRMSRTMPDPIGSLLTAFGVLPRPAAWPEIERIVASRPVTRQSRVLKLLFARLDGNDTAVMQISKDLAASIPSTDLTANSYLSTVRDAVNGRRLSSALRREESTRRVLAADQGGYVYGLESYVPRPQAVRILLSMFQRATRRTQVSDPATRRLAREVVLANLATIKRPPWELVGGMEDTAFLEKLTGRFGVAPLFESDDQERTAKNVYLAMLIDRGEIPGAASVLQQYRVTLSLHFENYCLAHRQFAGRLFRGIVALQKALPKLDFWYDYVAAAKSSGRLDEAAAHVASAESGADRELRRTLLSYLADLHLFAGRADLARKDLVRLVDLPRSPGSQNAWDPAVMKLRALGEMTGDAAASSAGISAELKQADWAPRDDSLIDVLVARGRSGQAEEFLRSGLRDQVSQHREGIEGNDYGYRLGRLYYLTNRPQKIVELLQTYPYWFASDLAGLVAIYGENQNPPGEFYLAWALAHSGQRAVAAETLRRTLIQGFQSDELYSLLNDLGGSDLLAFYDELHRAYSSQPRPLIWKGALLLKIGRVTEAERAVRAAIQMDPSDSQAPARHRFKAYDVLASILRREGRHRESAACEARVRAERIKERGDAFAGIGFYSKAIELYREAIKISPTDYLCETSLAESLASVGRLAESVEHSRRAFALVPRCFGPYTDAGVQYRPGLVGCEVIEEGRRMLAKAAKTGRSAAAAFVRGGWDLQVGRIADAATDFKLAVKLDPKFCVAWQALAGYCENYLEPAEKEAANFAVLALHPESQGALSCHYDAIRDLRVAYVKIEQMQAGCPKRSVSPLYTLHPSIEPEWPTSPLPWLNRMATLGSPPGCFLMEGGDVEAILRLYADFSDE